MSIRTKKRLLNSGEYSYTTEVRVRGIQQTRTFKSLEESNRWAYLAEDKLLRGETDITSGSENKKLSDAVRRFRDRHPYHEKNWLSKKSGEHFLDFWMNELGRYKIVHIRASQLIEARDKLLSKGRTPATANRYLSAISSLFQICVEEWFWIERNPARAIRRLREDNGRVRFLSDLEKEQLFKETRRDPELHDIVKAALLTGARRGELEKLKWSDLDRLNGTIIFRATKNGSDRVIPLSTDAAGLMRNRFSDRKLGCGDWVFPAPKSDGHADFRRRFPKAASRAELRDFKFHDLRHCAASHLAANGVSERKIAEILGHKTLQMVKRYTHLRPDHLREEMEILNQSLQIREEQQFS